MVILCANPGCADSKPELTSEGDQALLDQFDERKERIWACFEKLWGVAGPDHLTDGREVGAEIARRHFPEMNISAVERFIESATVACDLDYEMLDSETLAVSMIDDNGSPRIGAVVWFLEIHGGNFKSVEVAGVTDWAEN